MSDDERHELLQLQRLAADAAIGLARRRRDVVFVVVACLPDLVSGKLFVGSGIGHAAELVLVEGAGERILRLALENFGNNLPD